METIDDLLSRLLGKTQPYSPPLEIRESTQEDEPIPPSWVPVQVPDGTQIHAGYLLDTGQVDLGKTIENHAVLLVTDDFSLVHISSDGNVSIKQDGKRKPVGTLHLEGSSPFLEKENPFMLAIDDMGHPSPLLVPPLIEIMIYAPQSTRPHPSRRENDTSFPMTNISSLLLRQFLS